MGEGSGHPGMQATGHPGIQADEQPGAQVAKQPGIWASQHLEQTAVGPDTWAMGQKPPIFSFRQRSFAAFLRHGNFHPCCSRARPPFVTKALTGNWQRLLKNALNGSKLAWRAPS